MLKTLVEKPPKLPTDAKKTLKRHFKTTKHGVKNRVILHPHR